VKNAELTMHLTMQTLRQGLYTADVGQSFNLKNRRIDMKHNCSNCLYEPDWSEMSKGEYPRQTGYCKWNKPIQSLPQCFELRKTALIVRYDDDSGVHNSCKVWAPK